jgi:repressor of nif and glnA expression
LYDDTLEANEGALLVTEGVEDFETRYFQEGLQVSPSPIISGDSRGTIRVGNDGINVRSVFCTGILDGMNVDSGWDENVKLGGGMGRCEC